MLTKRHFSPFDVPRRACSPALPQYLVCDFQAKLILNLFSLMVDSSVHDIALDPDKVVLTVQEKFRLDLNDEMAVKHMQVRGWAQRRWAGVVGRGRAWSGGGQDNACKKGAEAESYAGSQSALLRSSLLHLSRLYVAPVQRPCVPCDTHPVDSSRLRSPWLSHGSPVVPPWVQGMIDESVSALFAQFVEKLHTWAQYWRK